MPPVTRRAVAARLRGSPGAISPVMAASLTEATPSMTSPSAGDQLAGLDQDDVADLAASMRGRPRSVARSRSAAAWRMVSARVRAQAVGLRLAAALGDRFGEVGEQHREPQPERDLPGQKPRLAPPDSQRREGTISVTSAATTSVTKITGLRDQLARVELDEGVAATRAASGSAAVERVRRSCRLALRHRAVSVQKVCAGEHLEVLDDRAEGEGREELQAAQDQDHADSRPTNSGRRSGRCRPTAAAASWPPASRRWPAPG